MLSALIYLYTNLSFATNASRLKLTRGGHIYGVYFRSFSKKLGDIVSTFFDYFSALFCYMSFVVMCGGFGATLEQQWGIPAQIGAFGLALLVIATTILGLNGILRVLSIIGPVIICAISFVAIVSAFTGVENYSENLAKIDSGLYADKMIQVGSGNPVYAAVSYGGFVVLWFAAFLAEIGAKNELACVNRGMALSSIFIFGTASICCIALISYADTIAGTDIPLLILTSQISPTFAQIFAVIICMGIYTSAPPLLWTGI